VRNRRLAAALAVVVVAGVAAVVVVTELPGSSRGASKPPVSSGAATVQRRDLVATDTESGTLGYASPQTVYNRLSGTITWLPIVGQQVKPGQTLFKVDNEPVVLLDGTTPAYRTLSSGVSDGPDVQELNENLVNLGFDPDHAITVDDTWQSATTAAVERWQAALGETQTGTVTLGQVVFLPGAQVISTISTVIGSTGGGGGGSSSGSSGSSGSSSSSASLETSAPRPEFVSLTETTTTPSSTTTPAATKPPKKHRKPARSNAQLEALIKLLQAEIAEMRSSRSSSGSRSPSASASHSSSGSASGSSSGSKSPSGSSGSSGAAAAEQVLQTTSTQKVVTVQLDATKQTEAVVGEQVTVELPDGSTVGGRISEVSSVAQSSSSSSGSGGGGGGGSGSSSATIPVTITLTGHRHINGLDQAAVSVNFVQQRANNVLSVPVTALIATQGGNYAVQEAAAPNSLIPVTPGLFAAGYVQISGPGISEGLQVTDSQG
jgi:hypothetical protein